MGDPDCCYENCPETADYEIIYGYAPDDYTHSCAQHLGLMIPQVKEATVIPLG